MTPSDHTHGHHGAHHDHGHSRVLDLDAEVFGAQLEQALTLAAPAAVGRIVDLGAGTGAGSRMLRAHFPEAEIICVDNDPVMLGRLHEQGFGTLAVDLDRGLPAVGGPVDLVWMSSSLHHVRHPERLLSDVRSTLAVDGVLIVVELAGLPSFLAGDDGLEDRCRAAADADGWNRHPDWRPFLESAGLAVTGHRIASSAPVTPAAREYARTWLGRYRQLPGIASSDREALSELLSRSDTELPLVPRATRTAWIATPA